MDSVKEESIIEILETWKKFVTCTETLNKGQGDLAMGSQIVPLVSTLCSHGLSSLIQDHFLQSLEETFKANAVSKFWKQFGAYCDTSKLDGHEGLLGEVLCRSLEGICSEMSYLERCLLILVQALQSYDESINEKTESQDCQSIVISKFQLMVSSVLLTTLPLHFQEILRLYFKRNLEELSTMIDADYESGDVSNPCDHNFNEQSTSHMDVDGSDHMPTISVNNRLVKSIGKVVRDLRSLGFTSLTEDAYASAIFFLLKNKVHSLAGEEYRSPVLESIKQWIQAVPMQFLNALLAYLGDSIDYDSPTSHKSPLASCPFSYPGIDNPSEGLVRWQLRLEYFAYETLQDLRIGKLFEIIVDYPDSSPAIEDLKQCLEYTGQHSKLVDSFISSLRYRLLTAGASTNDILHQYVSTIKALRTIDPAGVFLEAVGEPIRDYLKGRKDTIKCIVTMLTDGTGGNSTGVGNNVDSLLEEINKDVENQDNADCDEDINSDDKQAWMSAERWEPDPIEVDPLKGNRHRRKIDILAMMVSIIGSKEQLVNEYRVMLAEKLLNKSDYEIDSEIRTLELLKIHFGESIMQRCEIMTNDLIHSKRTNANIKASMPKSSISGSDQGESNLSLDHIDVTIISSNFWPPIQEEKLNLPSSIDQLLSDYAKRFHEVKTPRKLLWKKNLGTVKLELEFEDRTMQFTVTPLHATIIMQFQEQKSWTSKCLAGIVGVSDDLLHRKISYWVNKGVLIESAGEETNNRLYTLVDEVIDAYNNDQTSGNYDRFLAAEEEGEGSVASVEEQLRIEMTIYEKFIEGMLTNFGSLTLDRIHNSLKMFCSPEQPYDKSLQQLQSFLSSLISEDKLEMRDGFYYLKR